MSNQALWSNRISYVFESNKNVGYINKRNFIGRFGGPLDEFSNMVKIDRFGNRYSLEKKCINFKYENIKNNVLFVGDSTLAGLKYQMIRLMFPN